MGVQVKEIPLYIKFAMAALSRVDIAADVRNVSCDHFQPPLLQGILICPSDESLMRRSKSAKRSTQKQRLYVDINYLVRERKPYLYTVEPLNNGRIGTSYSVHYREVSSLWRLEIL